MRVVFCGSGAFAVPSLRTAASGEHEVAAVITQPPRRAGRGRRPRPTPVEEEAHRLGLDVRQCASINDEQMVARLQSLAPDVIAVADFGQLIRRRVRDVAPCGAFNLHASMLPELRGAAPVNWAILRGYGRTGVTTFSLVDRMDAGPVYLTAATDIDAEETAGELTSRLAELGAPLLCRTLDLVASGRADPHPQDESRATSAPRLSRAEGRIDWSADADAIRRRIHGTFPWPGAHAAFRSRESRSVEVILARARGEPGPADQPGCLDEDLRVRTGGGGRLRILELKPAGKRLMSWQDFVNGHRVRPGDRFQTPEP